MDNYLWPSCKSMAKLVCNIDSVDYENPLSRTNTHSRTRIRQPGMTSEIHCDGLVRVIMG